MELKPDIDVLIPTDNNPGHIVGCLIQGFNSLNCSVHINRSVESLIFNSRGVSTPFETYPKNDIYATQSLTHDLLVVDLSSGFGSYKDAILECSRQRPVVLITESDTSNLEDYPANIPTFSVHYNRNATKPGLIFPIGFGLSEDIISISSQQQLDKRNNIIVKNFNPSFSQSVRNSLDLIMVENLAHFFEIDRRNTTTIDSYVHQLSGASGVLAYGGEFCPDYLANAYLRDLWEKQDMGTKQRYTFQNFNAESVIFRWDSWRFYEAAVFACAPFQLDFELYGFELPKKPRPWHEYVPIDLSTAGSLPIMLKRSLTRDPDFLKNIGEQARQWVIQHYSPTSQARYVISKLIEIYPHNKTLEYIAMQNNNIFH